MVGQPSQADPLILLGAGASLKSGIPLSVGLVERAAKWAYCRRNGRDPDDVTTVRSDWWPWLESHAWYRRDLEPSENYSAVIEHLLLPREERREFFLRILKPHIPASIGYDRLLEFMANNIFQSVLTTNFDNVLADLSRSRSRPHHVELVKTPSDYTTISTVPMHPQVIYLHGSVEHYSDLNLLQEVQRLDEALVGTLIPLLRDHPLIVVGYRGAEPSIMHHLLLEQAQVTSGFRHGIFWCVRGDGSPTSLNPLIHELRDSIGNNLQLVPIDGFDELMAGLWSLYESGPSSTMRPGNEHMPGFTAKPQPSFDLQLMDDVTLDDLDTARLRVLLPEYCRRMGAPVPVPITRNWLLERLLQFDLAVDDDGTVRITNAGWLLFGQQPHRLMRSAQVLLRIGGESERLFDGNLWSQLDGIVDALEEVNRPFRLKRAISETALPYPPLALKELVVNAVVHRSYELPQRVVIEIEPDHIRITNPGGLVKDVLRQVELPIQEQIAQGSRGVKGYRNPVIADLFYGAGAMDKAGSGLADVQTWVRDNGGKVQFGPTTDNSAFDVVIFRRPEIPDATTGTAPTLITTARYISNLIELIDLPPLVWHGDSIQKSVGDIWRATEADWLPGFILHGSRLYTFADLTDQDNLLFDQVDQGNVEQLSIDEFMTGENGERLFVYLLNECLYRHLESVELTVDKKRKRAYFSRTDSGPREITYQARLRRATRTVTKPIISKNTGKVRYWDHEAIRFGFERFGDAWALRLVPTYVFTVNGWRSLVEGHQVGRLATRRAARDYNPNVLNDLVFWAWVLARGQDTIAIETGSKSQVSLSGRLADFQVRDTSSPLDIEDPELDLQVQQDLSALEDELASLAELDFDNDPEDNDGS